MSGSGPSQQLRFGYVRKEDRLALFVNGETVLLTRSLVRALINGLAGILEKTSAIQPETPADLREDVMSFEHHAALAGQSDLPPAQGTAPEAATPMRIDSTALRVLSDVDVTTLPAGFRLRLRAEAQVIAEIALNRDSLHRLIDALQRQAELAQWDIAVAPWLTEDSTHWVLN